MVLGQTGLEPRLRLCFGRAGFCTSLFTRRSFSEGGLPIPWDFGVFEEK